MLHHVPQVTGEADSGSENDTCVDGYRHSFEAACGDAVRHDTDLVAIHDARLTTRRRSRIVPMESVDPLFESR